MTARGCGRRLRSGCGRSGSSDPARCERLLFASILVEKRFQQAGAASIDLW